MTTLYLYPLGEDEQPLRQVIVALIAYGDGQGALDVLIPNYAGRLQQLFENPVSVRGERIDPWTPRALQYILDSGLYALGLHGEKQ